MLRILQVTDLHLPANPTQDTRAQRIDARWQQVLRAVKKHENDVDLLVLTGDLTHHSGALAYQRLVADLETLSIPAVWLPGNHDDIALMHEYGTTTLNQDCVDLQGWRLLFLNSTLMPDGKGSGSLGPRALQQLDHQLTGQTHTLVFLHHHPVPVNSRWQDEIGLADANAFWQCLAGHSNVRAIVFGHVHQQLELQNKGVALFSAPAVAPQFKAGCDEMTEEDVPALSGPAYAIYTLSDQGGVSARVYRLSEG